MGGQVRCADLRMGGVLIWGWGGQAREVLTLGMGEAGRGAGLEGGVALGVRTWESGGGWQVYGALTLEMEGQV